MSKIINIYKKKTRKLTIPDPKRVSVIIPNYNYQDYIIERIDSILMQTYPVYELIILDDCSSDNSVAVITEKIKTIKDIPVTFIRNEHNSGCAFKQWKRGFEAAKGDYIWIAEADDSCKNDFIEELIGAFDDEEVVLSYCESSRIDEKNCLIVPKSDDLYDMCRTGEWKKSYVWDGEREITEHLSVTNTILNVSSVLWKKRDYSAIFEKASEFKVAGDWYIYFNVLTSGKISWNCKALNYFRKHGKSVSTIVRAEIEFAEICRIQNEISEKYRLSDEIKRKQELRRSFMYPLLPEKDSGKTKIAWIIPHPGKGSGGHRTIIQNVNALIAAGYECDIFVEEDGISTPESVKLKINEWYEKCDAGIYVGFNLRKNYDLMFATGWQTIDFVRKLKAKKKAYFIQDYEPWFFPMGDQYLITENSYRYGFLPVTIGKWLSHKMESNFGNTSKYFEFCADLNIYKPLENIHRERAVCFVYQPEKPRRCDCIGLKALKMVKAMRPDVKIYLFGSNVQGIIDPDFINLNIIPIEKCNELYNTCKVGLCMSASNPSRIPFEMMAAGLPVVELYGENNIYDLPDEGVLLAEPSPEALAGAIVHLLDNETEWNQMSEFGKKFMREYPLEKGYNQFLRIVKDMLETDYNDASEIKPLYKKRAFQPTDEAKKIIIESQTTKPQPVEKRGFPVKVYKRCRKIARTILKKAKILM
jgi:glycosyltransferase involved in cell wall biosynthesis